MKVCSSVDSFRVFRSIKSRFFNFVFKNLHSNNNVLWRQIKILNFLIMENFKPLLSLQHRQIRWKWTLRIWNFLYPNSKFGILLKFHHLSSKFHHLRSSRSLSFDLKKYHVEMLSKHSVGKDKTIFLLLSGNFLAVFWLNFGFFFGGGGKILRWSFFL